MESSPSTWHSQPVYKMLNNKGTLILASIVLLTLIALLYYLFNLRNLTDLIIIVATVYITNLTVRNENRIRIWSDPKLKIKLKENILSVTHLKSGEILKYDLDNYDNFWSKTIYYLGIRNCFHTNFGQLKLLHKSSLNHLMLENIVDFENLCSELESRGLTHERRNENNSRN